MKNTTIQIRLTENEKTKLKEVATHFNSSISEYIRNSIHIEHAIIHSKYYDTDMKRVE